MKKIFILLLLVVSVGVNAQLIRPIEYKGMPAYLWKINRYTINSEDSTTTFELFLYFNTSCYENDKKSNLDFYQAITVDSIVTDDTSATTYQLIKNNSAFFSSGVIATNLQYNALSIEQAISDTIIGLDTLNRIAVVKNCIQDVKGKVIVLSLFINSYKDGLLTSSETIHLVVDNVFKFDGTQINEYDYFISNMNENNLTFSQAIQAGIQYADSYGIINAKLRGLR